MDSKIFVRLDDKKRLYFRAIMGTVLPYMDADDSQYNQYVKFYKDRKCCWDEKKLLALSEDELFNLYTTLDKQIESDHKRKKDGITRFIIKEENDETNK